MPEIPEDLLRLTAQHVHWTYHRRSACQCEDAGSDEHDVEQARRIIEALWPVAYRAGYAEAVARLRDDARYLAWWSSSDCEPDGPARRHLADYLETVGPDGYDVRRRPGRVDGPAPVSERCPECAELGHSTCYEEGRRAGREGAARDIGVVAEAAGWGEVWAQCVSIARGVSDAPTQAAEVDQPRTLLPGEVQDDQEAQR